MKKIATRILALFVVLVLLFTSFDISAFASYIELTPGMTFTLIKTHSGWTYQNNMASSTWGSLNIYNTSSAVKTSNGDTVVAGTPVYCLEFTAKSPAKAETVNTTWDNFLSTHYPSLTTAQKTGAKLSLIYGWPNFSYNFETLGDYSISRSNAQALQVATQMVLWEYLNGYRTYASGSSMKAAKAGLKQDATSLRYWTAVNKWGGNLKTAYLNILKEIARHNTKPSFSSTTVTLPYNSTTSTYTAKFTDSNGVMYNGWHWYIIQITGSAVAQTIYTDFSNGRSSTATLKTGGTITVSLGSGDTVNITATSPIEGLLRVGFQKYLPDGSATNATTSVEQLSLAIANPGVSGQQITAIGTPKIPPVYANLYVETGTTPPKAAIRKVDASTGDPVADAKYQLYTNEACTTKATTSTGENALIVTTSDADNPSNVLTMKEGTYYAKEIESPANYLLNAEVYKIEVRSNSTAIIDTSDIPYGIPRIHKTEEGSNKGVAGAKYDIYAEYTEGVDPSDNTTSGSEPSEGDDEIREDPDYKGTTYAYDVETGERAVLTTKADGSCNTVKLTPGTYYIKESSAPEGYQLDPNVYTIEVPTGESKVLELEDKTSNGSGEQVKTSTTDNNKIIAGATYGVYTTKDCTTLAKTSDTNVDAKFTTTSTGSNIVNLEAGTYYVKEITAPEGYTYDDTVYTVVIKNGETTKIEVSDAPKSTLKLTKSSDDATLVADNGCYSLSGAVYSVYSDSTCTKKVGTLTTTADGTTNTIQVDAGTYYVKEDKAPKGYALCTEVHSVTVAAGQTGTFTCSETPLNDPFALQLTKMAEDEENMDYEAPSTAGAIFSITYYDNTAGTTTGIAKNTWYFKTDANGKLRVSNENCLVNDTTYKSDALYKEDADVIYPLGTYVVKEVKAPDGYQLNGTMEFASDVAGSASVTEGLKFVIGEVDGKVETLYGDRRLTAENLSLNVYDAPDGGYGYIVKVDSIDTTKAIDGAVYGIYTDSACTTFAKTLDTNTDAKITTVVLNHKQVKLKAGTYYVKEISAPNGYTLNTKVYTAVIQDGKTTEIRAEDAPQSGVKLIKSSANTTLTNDNDSYSLKGAVYNVYSDENCTKQVGTLTTTADGTTNTITNLDAGTYYAKEVTASIGYALCTEVHQVTVTAGQTGTFTCKETPLNHPFALSLTKIDKDSKTALEGAIFKVAFFADSTQTSSGAPTKTWYFKTDSNGKLVVNNASYLVNDDTFKSDELYKSGSNVIFPLGTYKITEVQAPALYQLTGTMQFTSSSIKGSASVTDGLQLTIKDGLDGKAHVYYDTEVVENADLSVTATNEICRGSVNVIKYDSDSKTPLAGVTFKLVGDDGSEYTGTSDENGNVLFDTLLPQHYVLTEVSTVDGHSLLKDNIDVTLPVQLTEAEAKEQNADTTKAVWDEATGTYCFYDATYEISNDVTFLIPMTGGNPIPLYAGLAAALALIGTGVYFIMRKKILGE